MAAYLNSRPHENFTPATKLAFMHLLRSILQTDVASKAELALAKAMRDNYTIHTRDVPDEVDMFDAIPPSILEEAIQYNAKAIQKIRELSDTAMFNLLTVASKPGRHPQGQQLAKDIHILLWLTAETVNTCKRINDISLGIHIVTDFLRYPIDLSLLNFSSSGRITLPHFSHLEAAMMSLTWIHLGVLNLLRPENPQLAHLTPEHRNLYTIFVETISAVKNASKRTMQIFRVLMYSNYEGKMILQDFVNRLQPVERNDIILELGKLRTMHEHIIVLYEKIGYALTNIWSEYSGKEMTFHDILEQAKTRTVEPWHPNPEIHEPLPRSPPSKSFLKEIRKLLKKKKEKRFNKAEQPWLEETKRDRNQRFSRKEHYLDRVIRLFGRNPLDFMPRNRMPTHPVRPKNARKKIVRDKQGAARLTSTGLVTIKLRGSPLKPRAIKTKLHLLKHFCVASISGTTSPKNEKTSAADQIKRMQSRERGWK